jgi:hypothetical protein
MRRRETGALLFSAWLEVFWQPHRCRIKDSRSSLAALVRRVIDIAVIAREGYFVHTWKECAVLDTLWLLMLCAVSPFTGSNVVDIFDATTGNWSTAVLSVARYLLAATSLPNQGLAIFAGGSSTLCD